LGIAFGDGALLVGELGVGSIVVSSPNPRWTLIDGPVYVIDVGLPRVGTTDLPFSRTPLRIIARVGRSFDLPRAEHRLGLVDRLDKFPRLIPRPRRRRNLVGESLGGLVQLLGHFILLSAIF
jgi:hypothetical protein